MKRVLTFILSIIMLNVLAMSAFAVETQDAVEDGLEVQPRYAICANCGQQIHITTEKVLQWDGQPCPYGYIYFDEYYVKYQYKTCGCGTVTTWLGTAYYCPVRGVYYDVTW